jgi:hypothetical protein
MIIVNFTSIAFPNPRTFPSYLAFYLVTMSTNVIVTGLTGTLVYLHCLRLVELP